MLRKVLFALVIGMVAFTPATLALGLGEIKLNSNLNEPLDAEITLLSVRGETPEQIIAMLGSTDDFNRSGIDRLYFLTRIRFEPVSVSPNKMVIHLTTEDAVKEPFLNFLVSLEWPNGKLLREYTLLLDPPIFEETPAPTVTPVQTPRRSQPTTTSRPTPRPQPTYSEPAYDGEIYGPTDSNDTLWGIASKVKPGRAISIHRAMVAIYEENPQAFMGGNINRLKRGAELRIPDQSTFEQVSQQEALRLIREHETAWRDGTAVSSRVVDTSDYSEPQSDRSSSGTSTGRLSLATEEQAQEGSGGSNAAYAEEENLVLKQQNQELEEKSRSDAERIEQLERLLELKNEQLATLQQDSADSAQAESQTDTTTADQPVTEQSTTAAQQPEQQVTEPVQQKPAPVMPKPQPSFIDQVLDGAYNLYLGIAAVVILIIVFVMRARGKDDMSYQDAIENKSISTATETVTSQGFNADDLPETADEVLADESNLYETDTIDGQDSADPIGEADIYMAYGKFDQAESLLMSSIAQDEGRADLHAKLLECYAEMDSKGKFEAHLADIQDVIDTHSELSQMVHDVYSTAWPEGEFYSEESQSDFDDMEDAPEADADEDEVPSVDSMLDNEAEEIDDVADEFDTETEVDDLDDLPSTDDVFGEVESVSDEDGDELANEFADLDLDGELGLSDEDDEDIDSESDEAADDFEPADEDDNDTQLDLASAYIEMGDFEGAREIIEDVLESGSEQQKAQAQSLLDSIEN